MPGDDPARFAASAVAAARRLLFKRYQAWVLFSYILMKTIVRTIEHLKMQHWPGQNQPGLFIGAFFLFLSSKVAISDCRLLFSNVVDPSAVSRAG